MIAKSRIINNQILLKRKRILRGSIDIIKFAQSFYATILQKHFTRKLSSIQIFYYIRNYVKMRLEKAEISTPSFDIILSSS